MKLEDILAKRKNPRDPPVAQQAYTFGRKKGLGRLKTLGAIHGRGSNLVSGKCTAGWYAKCIGFFFLWKSGLHRLNKIYLLNGL